MIVFWKRWPGTSMSGETNNWNQFTLLELLAVKYRLLTPDPAGGDPNRPSMEVGGIAAEHSMQFPDLTRVSVRHATADRKSWTEEIVDLASALNAANCSKNIPLRWGDLVEIPQTDHLLSETWRGFSKAELEAM